MTVEAQLTILHLAFKIMALGFKAQRLLQQTIDRVHPATADCVTKIDMEIRPQAHMYLSIAGQAQPVAIAAKIMCHRRDETQP